MKRKKFNIDDYIGKVEGLTLTGRVLRDTGKVKWECICNDCGGVSYKAPADVAKGVKCRPCHYERYRGQGHGSYKGTRDIPGIVLSQLTKSAEKRTKDLDVDITLQDIQDVYDSQEGLCVYTGIDLWFGSRVRPGNASVDRIDSDKGYTKDNIQIIDKAINQLKSDHNEKSFIDMCCLVADHSRRGNGKAGEE